MANKGDATDPKGLIYEAYRISGISAGQCRSIFLDWALSLPPEQDQRTALKHLHDAYFPDFPEHPMSEVIRQGLAGMAAPRRRGGWRSRPRN